MGKKISTSNCKKFKGFAQKVNLQSYQKSQEKSEFGVTMRKIIELLESRQKYWDRKEAERNYGTRKKGKMRKNHNHGQSDSSKQPEEN